MTRNQIADKMIVQRENEPEEKSEETKVLEKDPTLPVS